MLVAIGAALFAGAGVLVVPEFSDVSNAMSLDIIRVIAATATGIGFLGAGVIFQSGGNVQGITTAAGIWVTAGIGLLAGLGMVLLAVGAGVIAVIVIAILSSDVLPGSEG